MNVLGITFQQKIRSLLFEVVKFNLQTKKYETFFENSFYPGITLEVYVKPLVKFHICVDLSCYTSKSILQFTTY